MAKSTLEESYFGVVVTDWEVVGGTSVRKSFSFFSIYLLVAQRLKHLPAMRETWIRSLGGEDPPGKGNGSPLQYSWLENPMDRGAWRATVHGVAKSRTRLSGFTYWLHWVSVAVQRLSLVLETRGYCSVEVQWFLLLQSTGSRHVGFSSCGSLALEHRLSTCGTGA